MPIISAPLARSVLAGFEYDYAEFTANVSVAATAEGTPTTIVSGNSVTYDGSTVILVECFLPQLNATNAVRANVSLYDGAGNSIGVLMSDLVAVAYGTGSDTGGRYMRRRLTPSAGAHTYIIGGWNGAAGTIVYKAGAGGAGVTVPGFIRITRAA